MYIPIIPNAAAFCKTYLKIRPFFYKFRERNADNL